MVPALDDDFRIFLLLLAEAATNMEEHYFGLPSGEQGEPIFHERAYCYELYHQLRELFEKNSFQYMLDGVEEIKARPTVRGSHKPDFIVNLPGKAGNNLAVVEIKPVTAEKKDLKNDIITLDGFMRNPPKYFRGIMLIYGEAAQDSQPESIKKAQQLIRRFNDKIILMWHRIPNEKPEFVNSIYENR